jgi:hypothetical protein
MRFPILRLFGLLALSACPAGAQTNAQVHIDYKIYAHGLHVAALEAGFDLNSASYRLDMSYRTTGLIGWLFKGDQINVVQGGWEHDRPEPQRFFADGVWRGQARRTLIDYVAGRPLLRQLVPPNEEERETVPPELLPGTVDTLSAIVELIRDVAETGKCETQARTFDGRRLVALSAHTAGEEELERTDRSSFSGPALRCDFEGRMLGGFLHIDDAGERGRLRRGSAWFARAVPDAPRLPVRMEFETVWFGDATMYMTGAGPGATRTAAKN